jgi:hypothetical protein
MTLPKAKRDLLPVGRKSEFKPEYSPIAQEMCQLGATNADLAQEFNVSVFAIAYWQVKYPKFAAALKIGKDAADERVERSLFQRAIDGDVTAQIFWLKNRRPDRWRDVQRIEAALGHYVISERPLTEEEWARDRASVIDSTVSPLLDQTKD